MPCKQPNLTVRLQKENVQPGMNVDVVPAKGSVACILSRAAIGKIMDLSSVISYPQNIKSMHTTRHKNIYVAVQVEKFWHHQFYCPNLRWRVPIKTFPCVILVKLQFNLSSH